MAVLQFRPQEPLIYKIQIELQGANPPVWRDVLVESDSTVYMLAKTLVYSIAFAPEYPWSLKFMDHSYGNDLSRMTGDIPSTTPLYEILRIGEEYLFEYDVWKFSFTLVESAKRFGRYKCPACCDGAGESPLDYCDGPEEFAEYQAGKKPVLIGVFGDSYKYSSFNKKKITTCLREPDSFEEFAAFSPDENENEDEAFRQLWDMCTSHVRKMIEAPGDDNIVRTTLDRLKPSMGEDEAFRSVCSVYASMLVDTMPPFNKELSLEKFTRALKKL